MKLILVHGRSQLALDPVGLQKTWMQALADGLATHSTVLPKDTTISFPYYGNKLAMLLEQADAPQDNDVAAKGGDQQDKQAELRAELAIELAHNAGISDAPVASEGQVDIQEKGPLNWAWVHAVLKTLDGTQIGSAVLETFTKDVSLYLSNPAVARQIDAIVAAAFDDQPCVVVSHSLGTIIAYRVLRDLGNKANVRGLVTVGSPLGLQSVRDYLVPPALAMPAGVRRWFNAYDKRDVVALRPLDTTTWDIAPPIANLGNVNNFTDNRHGIAGCLSDANVASWILDAMTG